MRSVVAKLGLSLVLLRLGKGGGLGFTQWHWRALGQGYVVHFGEKGQRWQQFLISGRFIVCRLGELIPKVDREQFR